MPETSAEAVTWSSCPAASDQKWRGKLFTMISEPKVRLLLCVIVTLSRSEKKIGSALTTFREPQPPNNVKEAVNLFLDLQTNVSPKDVAKRLQDAGYNLEKNM